MDGRNVLTAGTILSFPGMECEIDSVAGCGSNAIVYCGHYHDQQNIRLVHQVLVKELFPYDPNGKIYRDRQGSICVEPEARDIMELHRLSFLRGNEIHIRLLMQHPGEIDANINTFEWNHTFYTILGFSGGRSLEKELQSGKNHSLKGIVKWIREALEGLEAFHTSGYLHLDISPDNILLIGQGKKERVTLIDYNSVHTLTEIREGDSVYYSAKEGYTAPEIRGGRKREIGFCSDLYAMTAVFYTCLTGKRLTLTQSLRTSVPDISGAECLQGCPSTVISMVRAILKKGLETIPRRRYQSAAQMLTDLGELEDRIEGKGITHWALWETGRAKVIKTIKENTALGYICEKEKLYPLRGTTESGEQVSLTDTEFLYGIENRKPLLLIGSGGMGKTTALLRMGYHQSREYSPTEPAIIYLSLFDWKDSGDTYIRDRILENLRFKPQTDSMETARHELIRLLSEPIHTKRGDRPVLILLLDGFNEASGDTGPLKKEMNELALLGGIQLVITSRSEMTGFECQRIALERLKREEVRRVLAEQGILAPENMELLELLHVPMLLSMFINTVLAEKKQLQIDTKEELLNKYFDAILEKEVRRLPESSQECWGIQAAVQYVLPEIAALSQRYGRAVSDTELLKLMEGCYKELGKKTLTAVFPQWIGHVSDMKMGAEDADSWYGKVILDFLWKRLGLIVRDDQGNFRILHQMVEEYLVDRSAGFHKEFDRQKKKYRNWKLLAASGTLAAIVVVLSLSFAMYNAHMLEIISESNRETLKYESRSLSQLSTLELENGNARKAAATAISGLPSEQNQRPYVADAEKALSDALGIYRYPHYQAADKVAIESEIKRFGYTANGDFLVIMDDSDLISCIDGRNGKELWNIQSMEPYEYVEITIVEEQQAVLLAGKKSSKSVSLVTGEILWEAVYEEAADTHISDASLLMRNDQFMVQEIVTYDDYGSCIFLQYMVFDIKTGILKSKTENLLEEEIYRDYVSQNRISMIQRSYGEITENHVCAVTLEFSLWENRDFWLLWFDLESGKLLERSIFQIDSEEIRYIFNEKEWLYGYRKEAYSPEGELLGEFFCIRDKERNETLFVEFFPEEEEGLCFVYQEIFAFADENHKVFVYGNAIYGLGYDKSIAYISYEKEIVRCIETDEHTLYLLFSDGSTEYFNIEEFHKGDIRLNSSLIGRNIEVVQDWGRNGRIYSENEEVFYVRLSDTGELIRCQPTEDKNSRHIDVASGLFRESTTYVTLDRDVLFSMNWDYALDAYQAAVIDVENGCAFENFTLNQVLYKDECFGISVDQKLLLFQDFLYDWSSDEKIPLDQINTEQLEDRKIQLFENISTNKNDWEKPVSAVGDVKKWIATADTDQMIRVYDLETDTYIQECDPDIDFSEIRSLTFIMEDQYLKVRTNDYIMIIDVQSGEVVYEQYQDYSLTESDYWWNDQARELFLYNGSDTGYCVDTDSWTEKYEIDHLVFASDQAIVTNNYSCQYDGNSYHDAVIIYPYYSLEQKIQLAEERFNLSEETIMTQR